MNDKEEEIPQVIPRQIKQMQTMCKTSTCTNLSKGLKNTLEQSFDLIIPFFLIKDFIYLPADL